MDQQSPSTKEETYEDLVKRLIRFYRKNSQQTESEKVLGSDRKDKVLRIIHKGGWRAHGSLMKIDEFSA